MMMHITQITPHYALSHYTADEVAECLDYGDFLSAEESNDLYVELWNIQGEAENPTPSGGDGSDGTVETPADQIGDFDDTVPYWWNRLSIRQQEAINNAAQVVYDPAA